MKISVFGTGYVGLVTGVCFAEMGNTVLCMDVDAKKIEDLQSGRSPIFEPGLDDLLLDNIKAKRLLFTTTPEEAVIKSDLLIIAVGTPPNEDGSADSTYVMQVADTIAQYMNGYKLVVTKSTVPIGTNLKVKNRISESLK